MHILEAVLRSINESYECASIYHVLMACNSLCIKSDYYSRIQEKIRTVHLLGMDENFFHDTFAVFPIPQGRMAKY